LSHSFALTSVSLQETLVGWKKTSATRLHRLADATLIRIDLSNTQDCATETQPYALCLGDLVFDLLQGGGIVHGGQVTRIAAFGHGLDGTTQQFATACLRQSRHKNDA
jgi:hypothetical protein